jgi:tripartite-type tricarboxylate transporter receptor subunit TctC
LAEQISRTQGPTIVIDNRPGATTVTGTEAAARTPPDGAPCSPMPLRICDYAASAWLRPLNSFEPICSLVSFPMVIAVNSAAPYRTLDDLLKSGARKSQSPDAGQAHIAFEKLKRAANVNIIFVRYAVTAPAVNALLGEHVTSYLGHYTDVVEQVKALNLRVLATAARTRIAALPDVPTTLSPEMPIITSKAGSGLFAPAKMPKETVSQLAVWFTAAVQAPEVKAKLVGHGLYPVGMCGTDFSALLRKQYDEFGRGHPQGKRQGGVSRSSPLP